MTCFECAKEITSYPCACGYRPKALEAQQQWIVRHCHTPGCFTAIREKLGRQSIDPICKWCMRGESYAMNNKLAVDVRLRGVEIES